jgi:hypothetical protein
VLPEGACIATCKGSSYARRSGWTRLKRIVANLTLENERHIAISDWPCGAQLAEKAHAGCIRTITVGENLIAPNAVPLYNLAAVS